MEGEGGDGVERQRRRTLGANWPNCDGQKRKRKQKNGSGKWSLSEDEKVENRDREKE